MENEPRPPKVHQEFINRFPKLQLAWESIAEAGKQGPLDERTAWLVTTGDRHRGT